MEHQDYDYIHANYWLQHQAIADASGYERLKKRLQERIPVETADDYEASDQVYTSANTVPTVINTYGNYLAKYAIITATMIDCRYKEAKPSNESFYTKRPIFDNLIDSLSKVDNLTEAIAIARRAGFEKTADRLGKLLLFQEEDETEKEPLSLLSMKHLIEFLIKHSGLREPSIVVTNEGRLKAIWELSESQIFWIEFYPSGDVRYLAFVPNEARSDGVECTAGWSTTKDVYRRAESLDATDWMLL
ncbi:hypothetical protein [Desulfobacca acetoxidans]|nr:hypothetical protein [Desulfobacterales bacterium]